MQVPGIPLLIATCLTLVLGACSTAPAVLESPDERARASTPIGRAPRLVAGRFSYRLGGLQRSRSGLRVDLLLANGRSEHAQAVLLRVVARGPEGELASIRLAAGGIRAGETRALAAHFPPLDFPVRDIGLELITAAP